MARQKRKVTTAGQGFWIILTAYYATVGLLLLASLAPQGRVWGFNWWAYLPTGLHVVLLLVALAATALPLFFMRGAVQGNEESAPNRDSGPYFLLAGVFSAVIALCFVVFSAQTHFLGDGYQLLARLTDHVKSAKLWDAGISMIQDSVFAMLGEGGRQQSLLTFRLISYGSGIILLIGTIMAARAMFSSNVRRFLFFAGIVSGGYMLQFFGYVENYALLIAAMTIYTLIGVLAGQGRIARWWVVLPFLVAVFSHGFGLVLLPSLVYLFAKDSRPAEHLRALSTRARWTVGVSILVAGFVVYTIVQQNVYFFTFALLPILPDRFTVESDYLLSFKHLLDILNLLVLLLPGLFVFVATLLFGHHRKRFRGQEYSFLISLFVPCLIAVYVFNPGIGMPRNWDLFSIVGVPLVVTAYYFFLKSIPETRSALLAASLSIVLGFLVLIPRITSQAVPDIAIAHFRNYLELDRLRNRNARSLLVDYYRSIGDSATANAERAQAKAEFTETSFSSKGKDLLGQGKYREAEKYLSRAIEINPLYYEGYSNLGACLLQTGRYDSAVTLLEIANGLNPYNTGTLTNLGTAYLRLGEYQKAREYLLDALSLDSLHTTALASMATVALRLERYERSLRYVSRLYKHSDMPFDYFRQAGEAYLDEGATEQAAQALKYAVDRGLDERYVLQLEKKYPELDGFF
jgi:Tfp pilus assembly protein PilF